MAEPFISPVGICLSAGSVLTSVTRRFGVNGLISAVPTITGKQPDRRFLSQSPPVGAEFIKQNGTEHHVAILATLAALDVDHHTPAIDVADLQASQLRVPDAGGVEGHEERAMERSASCIDELRHFFLAEDRRQSMSLFGVRSVGDTPRPLQRLDVEKTEAQRWFVTEPGDNFRWVNR